MVTFNLISDMNVPKDCKRAIHNGIKFVFEKYFHNTQLKLPNSITKINTKSAKMPVTRMSSDYFIGKYLANYNFPKGDFHVIMTKHCVDGKRVLGENRGFAQMKGGSIATIIRINMNNVYDAAKFFGVPASAILEYETRHEFMHSHLMFLYDNFFKDGHCPNKNCLMHYNKNSKKLLDLCPECQQAINKFRFKISLEW